MTYASLKLSFILAEKRQVLSYIFYIKQIHSSDMSLVSRFCVVKVRPFWKKRICLDLSFCLKEKNHYV